MLLPNLNLLATAPGGVAWLRELILTLAVQGKLVPQDPNDEPASELLKRIRVEKDRLIAEGKIKRDKPLAEIAGEEKPFELPKGWVWSNLATIGIINPRNDAPDETMASFVQMSSIPVAYSASHAVEPRPWRDIKSGFTQFAEGDVGVAKITPCFENGKSTVFQNLSNGIGAGTTELHIVRPLGGIVPRYVLLFLKTPAFLLNGEAVMTGSAGQKRMPRNYFESTPFPLPPLAEQSRIVTRVDELMRLCDALEAKGQLEVAQHAQLVATLLGALTDSDTPVQLAENWQRVASHFDLLLDRPQAVDALEQTILQLAVRGLLVPQDPQDEPASELVKKIRAEKDQLIAQGKIKRDKPLPPIAEDDQPFALPQGWEWVTLGLLTSLVTSGSRSWKDFYSAEGATFIRSQDIKYDRLEFDDRAFVKLPPGTEGVRTQVRLQDLLITITGANVGKAAVVSQPVAEAYVSQHVALVRLHNVRLVDYLHLWLVSEYEGRKLLLMSSYGAKPGLNLQNINNLLVPLPPLAEQSRIVTRVTELRQLCAELRTRLSASQSTQAQLAEALVGSVGSGVPGLAQQTPAFAQASEATLLGPATLEEHHAKHPHHRPRSALRQRALSFGPAVSYCAGRAGGRSTRASSVFDVRRRCGRFAQPSGRQRQRPAGPDGTAGE